MTLYRRDLEEEDGVGSHEKSDLLEWAQTLHPSSLELQDDPYPHYAKLRSQCPVARSEVGDGFWILSKYDDIQFVLQSHARFSSRQVTVDHATFTSLGPDIPTHMDPPEHSRYRKLMNPWFRPTVVEAMEADMRATAIRLIEPVLGGHEWDFLNDFAIPFPCAIFLDLMGLPAEDLPMLLSWKDQILRATTAEALAEAFGTVKVDLRNYFQQIYRDRHAQTEPGDDLIGTLISVQVDGERPLDESEFVRSACLMWGAGLDTVTSQLSLAINYLAENLDKRDELTAHPDRIPNAVEELIRYDSLVSECRVATEDVQIRGRTIRAGDIVWMLFGSAGRDEDQFADPDVVDFDRTQIRHLGFGGGVHRCLGSHLARAELRIAMEEIHRLVPTYRIDEIRPPTRHSGYVRGVDSLHLLID
jgi:cytochrome P450